MGSGWPAWKHSRKSLVADSYRLDLDQQILEREAGDADGGRAPARLGIELALDLARSSLRRRSAAQSPAAWIVDIELGDVALVQAAFGQRPTDEAEDVARLGRHVSPTARALLSAEICRR